MSLSSWHDITPWWGALSSHQWQWPVARLSPAGPAGPAVRGAALRGNGQRETRELWTPVTCGDQGNAVTRGASSGGPKCRKRPHRWYCDKDACWCDTNIVRISTLFQKSLEIFLFKFWLLCRWFVILHTYFISCSHQNLQMCTHYSRTQYSKHSHRFSFSLV